MYDFRVCKVPKRVRFWGKCNIATHLLLTVGAGQNIHALWQTREPCIAQFINNGIGHLHLCCLRHTPAPSCLKPREEKRWCRKATWLLPSEKPWCNLLGEHHHRETKTQPSSTSQRMQKYRERHINSQVPFCGKLISSWRRVTESHQLWTASL